MGEAMSMVLEEERVAKLICCALNPNISPDTATFQGEIARALDGTYILPNASSNRPLWHKYIWAARAVIEDRKERS